MEVVGVAAEEVAVEDVEDKMMQELKCPLCEKKLYSSVGSGCMFCGMPLENEEDEFCSDDCKENYIRINLGEEKQ